MNKLIIPPAPNWYYSSILACAPDNTIVYGSRGDLSVIKPKDRNEPANVTVISRCHSDKVVSVALNHNWGEPDKLAVSTGDDKVVHMWDIDTCVIKMSQNGHTTNKDSIVGAVFAGYNKIVSVSYNGFIIIWRWADDDRSSIKGLFPSKTKVSSLSPCPHVSWLMAFGTQNGIIYIADMRKSGRIVHRLKGHNTAIISLSWCPSPINIFPKAAIKKVTALIEGQNKKVAIEQSNEKDSDQEIKKHDSEDLALAAPNNDLSDDTSVVVDQYKCEITADIPEILVTLDEESPRTSLLDDTVQEVFDNTAHSTAIEDVDIIERKSEPSQVIGDADSSQNQINMGAETEDVTNDILDKKTEPSEVIPETEPPSNQININAESVDVIDAGSSKNHSRDDEEIVISDLASLDTETLEVNVSGTEQVENLSNGSEDIECTSEINGNEEPQEVVSGEKEYLLASVAREGKSIVIWRAGTDGRKQTELKFPSASHGRNWVKRDLPWMTSCWVKPNIMLSSSLKNELLLWDLRKAPNQTKFSTRVVHNDHDGTIFCIAAPIKTGTSLEEENWRTEKLNVWSSGQDKLLLNTSLASEHETLAMYTCISGSINCFETSPMDPNRLAFGTGDGNIRIWDLSRPHFQYISTMSVMQQRHSVKILSLAWHPVKEGCLGCGTSDGQVGLVDINNNKSHMLVHYLRTGVHTVQWGPLDGDTDALGLYACGEGKLIVYKTNKTLDDPVLIEITKDDPIQKMSWRADYGALAVGTKCGIVYIYSIDLKLLTTLFIQQKAIQCLQWHPQATAEDNSISPYFAWLAVGTKDTNVVVYDCAFTTNEVVDQGATENVIANLIGHKKPTKSLAWSPYEGGKLATASEDGTVLVWNVKTKSLMAMYNNRRHDFSIAITWSPLDPDYIISGGRENVIEIWKISEHPLSENSVNLIKRQRNLNPEAKPFKIKPSGAGSSATKRPKRHVMLNSISQLQAEINSSGMLVDCRRLLALKGEGNSGKADVLQLFGSRQEMMDLLEIEKNRHNENGKPVCHQHVSLWKGDLGDAIKDSIAKGIVTPWLIAMAPMVSPKLWQECCEAYAKQLSEQENTEPQETASYYLACHNVNAAIEVLCKDSCYRDALALAKCRLPASDPLINDIVQKWATYSIIHGSYEVAAQCFISLGKYEDAAKALYKRSDVQSLELATELAHKSENKDLYDATVHRLNLFKNLNPEDKTVPLPAKADVMLGGGDQNEPTSTSVGNFPLVDIVDEDEGLHEVNGHENVTNGSLNCDLFLGDGQT